MLTSEEPLSRDRPGVRLRRPGPSVAGLPPPGRSAAPSVASGAARRARDASSAARGLRRDDARRADGGSPRDPDDPGVRRRHGTSDAAARPAVRTVPGALLPVPRRRRGDRPGVVVGRRSGHADGQRPASRRHGDHAAFPVRPGRPRRPDRHPPAGPGGPGRLRRRLLHRRIGRRLAAACRQSGRGDGRPAAGGGETRGRHPQPARPRPAGDGRGTADRAATRPRPPTRPRTRCWPWSRAEARRISRGATGERSCAGRAAEACSRS